jgi:hypothetical protein
MKKIWLSLIALITMLTSCGGNSKIMNSNDVIGKYINIYEPNSDHFVELFANGTFNHQYNGEEGDFENKGIWKLHQHGDKVEISFDSWKSYGKGKDNLCSGCCLSFVVFKNDVLVFDVDLPMERNFEKVK